jgi:hypothetical protein
MGQVLHGCARTTAAVRRAIQHSQKSLNGLAEQYGINPKTLADEGRRSCCCRFPKYTLLPLDDCLYALQPSIPSWVISLFRRRRAIVPEPMRRGGRKPI